MKYIIALLLTLGINTAKAEAVATMPNEGQFYLMVYKCDIKSANDSFMLLIGLFIIFIYNL